MEREKIIADLGVMSNGEVDMSKLVTMKIDGEYVCLGISGITYPWFGDGGIVELLNIFKERQSDNCFYYTTGNGKYYVSDLLPRGMRSFKEIEFLGVE